VTAGTGYQVELDSYASCTFNHWQDTGNSADPRPFTQANGPMTFVGVYSCTSVAGMTQGPSIGMVLYAIVSEASLPIGFMIAALGSLGLVRIIGALSRNVRGAAWQRHRGM
jgi:hypothetical protein